MSEIDPHARPVGPPQRYARRGEAADTFRAFLAIEDDRCIFWPWGRASDGYGQIKWKGEMTRTHRVACTMRHGPKPAGREVAHSCRNILCMNYRHLRWATPFENAQDRIQHGTSGKGEACGTSKLTRSEVKAIVNEYRTTPMTQRDVASKWGISQTHVSQLHLGKRWGWLDKAAS